jgi:hypothetical protein
VGAYPLLVDHHEGAITHIDVAALDEKDGISLLNGDGAEVREHQ